MARRAISVGEPSGKITKTKAVGVTLEEEAQALLARVATIRVRTQQDCAEAAELARRVRQQRERWKQHEYPVVAKAKDSYDTARDRYNKIEKPLKAAEDLLKRQVGDFKLAVRRVTETTLKATNRQLVERQSAAFEQQTSTVERAIADAVQRREADVQQAEAVGDLELAARLRAQPLDVEVVDAVTGVDLMLGPGSLEEALAPEDGIRVGEGWEFEVLDAEQVPDEYWSVDERKVKAAVAVTKGATRIPGIRVYPKPRVSIR
jgi:hypothetical protein